MSDVLSVNTKVTPDDLGAALIFIRKRARKRADAVDGVSAALFSVMFATCNGLVECGLSIENVDSMLDQMRQQVTANIRADHGLAPHLN